MVLIRGDQDSGSSGGKLRAAQKADFGFKVGSTEFSVAAFKGTEEISRPFLFHLELVSPEGDISFKDMVGQPGLLTISGTETTRYVHGMVLRFEQVGEGDELYYYQADLVPEIRRLSFRSHSRIFVKMSVKDIIGQVFQKAGLQAPDISVSLTDPREYCTQYEESDFNFVSRLMEEEGWFYFFSHSKSGHKMKIADKASATGPCPERSGLKYQAGSGLAIAEEAVSEFRYSEEMRTGKVALKHYDYMQPSTYVEASKQADRDTDNDWYLHDHGFDDQLKSPASRHAPVRLEEVAVGGARGAGKTQCRTLVAGYRIDLTDYPKSAANQEYLLTVVRHDGYQPQVKGRELVAADEQRPVYRASFEGIPASVTFRPARITPRPMVRGTQTAVVVGQGPSAKEAVTVDEYGRAHVKFHWPDSTTGNDGSARWVRVSQGYAGATHGIQFPPLDGDEVIVDFIDGDPDRPIITGRVYNGTNKAPLKPEDKVQNVILTPYQHRILFDDKKKSITINTGGSETVFLEDGDSKEFGNNIKLSTKDEHFLQLAMGDKHKGAVVQTKAKHKVEMRDDPDPGIFIVDKDGKIYLHLDTQNKTIKLINEQSGEINIECKQGKVSVVASDIVVDAKNKVDIKGGSEISLKAPKIKVAGDASAEIKAPQLKMEGSAKAELKGAMTTVEGSGTAELKGGAMTNISGGLVKIN